MAGVVGISEFNEVDIQKGIADVRERDDVITPRDFFWDRINVFLSTLLVVIGSLTIVTELLNENSNVACDFTNYDNISDSTVRYILTVCSPQGPTIQYLPIYLIVQGVLLLITHFIWKGMYLSQIEQFFSLVSTLKRIYSSTTNNYPYKNKSIINRIYSLYRTYDSYSMFYTYVIKIIVQFTISVIAIIISCLPHTFNDFGTTFNCSSITNWPLSSRDPLTCVLVNSRLLQLIWCCNIILLGVLFPLFLVGVVWSFLRHRKELGYRDSAALSFLLGVAPAYAVGKPYFSNMYSDMRSSSQRWSLIRKRFFQPRIVDDFHFLVMLLFVSDADLGNVFYEGQIQLEMERLFDTDQQLLETHNRQQMDTQINYSPVDIETDEKTIFDVQWDYPHDVYYKFDQKISIDRPLVVPGLFRGAVMGYGLRAPDNIVAMEIGFGSPFPGISLALARTFQKVGYVYFDALYRPTVSNDDDDDDDDDDGDDSKDEENKIVETREYATNLISFRVQDNIFSQPSSSQNQFKGEIETIWKYSDDVEFPVSYIVIGPLTKKQQCVTVEVLMNYLVSVFTTNSVVLLLKPLSIEGKSTRKQFYDYRPPMNLFQPLVHNMSVTSRRLQWPLSDDTSPDGGTFTVDGSTPLTIHCGENHCQVQFSAYRFVGGDEQPAMPSPEESTANDKLDVHVLVDEPNVAILPV